jgi:hypothetical protein
MAKPRPAELLPAPGSADAIRAEWEGRKKALMGAGWSEGDAIAWMMLEDFFMPEGMTSTSGGFDTLVVGVGGAFVGYKGIQALQGNGPPLPDYSPSVLLEQDRLPSAAPKPPAPAGNTTQPAVPAPPRDTGAAIKQGLPTFAEQAAREDSLAGLTPQQREQFLEGLRKQQAEAKARKLLDEIANPPKKEFNPDAEAQGYRARLLEKELPPENMNNPQAHHDLPQEYRARFEKLGIDIDDPAYLRWVEGGKHQSWSPAFNKEWRGFFETNPNPTKEAVLNQMNKLRNDSRFQ